MEMQAAARGPVGNVGSATGQEARIFETNQGLSSTAIGHVNTLSCDRDRSKDLHTARWRVQKKNIVLFSQGLG